MNGKRDPYGGAPRFLVRGIWQPSFLFYVKGANREGGIPSPRTKVYYTRSYGVEGNG